MQALNDMRMSKKKPTAEDVANEIAQLSASIQRLRTLGVIRSQKIVGDVGEWIAAALFGGRIAEAKNQKGWDLACDMGNIQVRAHAKSEDNRTSWTSIAGLPNDCKELAVVVLTHELKISRVFRVPTAEAKRRARKERLAWSAIGEYEVLVESLPAFKKLLPLVAKTSNNAFKRRRAKTHAP